MSERIEEIQTKSRVCLCDRTIDVDARLDSRKDAEALVARVWAVAAVLWPEDQERDQGLNREADAAGESSGTGALGGLPDQGKIGVQREGGPEDAISLSEARRKFKEGVFPVQVIEEIVAQQLADDEFEKLSPAQAEAVALRRLGLTVPEITNALCLNSENAVWSRIGKAKDKGVTADAPAHE